MFACPVVAELVVPGEHANVVRKTFIYEERSKNRLKMTPGTCCRNRRMQRRLALVLAFKSVLFFLFYFDYSPTRLCSPLTTLYFKLCKITILTKCAAESASE